VECYSRLLAAHPAHADGHNNLGVALQALGQHEEAAGHYRQAVALKPDFIGARYNLGNALLELGRHEEALASYRAVSALDPAYPENWNNQANVLAQLGRREEALAAVDRALALKPDYPVAHQTRGSILHALGRFKEAEQAFVRVLALQPGFPGIYNDLGAALYQQGKTSEALRCFEQALAGRPDFAKAHYNRGKVLQDLGRPQEAIEAYRRALEYAPDHAPTHNNLAYTWQNLGNLSEALNSLERALALKPDYAEAHSNRAFFRLLNGNLAGGWPDYEWRFEHLTGKRYAPDPRDGTRLLPRPSSLLPLRFEGRRILLLRDQGIGDEIFFLRCAPLAKARGAWLAYQPSAKVLPLVKRVGCLDAVVEGGALPEALDHIFLVGELPLVLGINRVEDIPPPLRLNALPERVEAMRARLAALGPGPVLGATWRGGLARKPGQKELLFKAIDPELLGRALSGWPGPVLMVQRQPTAEEVAAFERGLGRGAHDFSASNEDLEEILALLSLLDEYVGVSNTNMHLLAGLGKAARVLVPHPPEWRWMAAGGQSPWFPGFKVYREDLQHGWGEALGELQKELEAGGSANGG